MTKPHLFLIGYRGAGKTTIAKQLADQLGWAMVDADEIIEQQAGMSIREIFAADGEPGFRDREQDTVNQISALPQPTVISLGGGAVLRETNRQNIQRTGRVIWLRASPETLYARIVSDETGAQRRPNLSSGGGFAEVAEILARREPIYQQLADYVVDTDGLGTDKICHTVLRWIAAQHTA